MRICLLEYFGCWEFWKTINTCKEVYFLVVSIEYLDSYLISFSPKSIWISLLGTLHDLTWAHLLEEIIDFYFFTNFETGVALRCFRQEIAVRVRPPSMYCHISHTQPAWICCLDGLNVCVIDRIWDFNFVVHAYTSIVFVEVFPTAFDVCRNLFASFFIVCEYAVLYRL